jgi:hypothetical protein
MEDLALEYIAKQEVLRMATKSILADKLVFEKSKGLQRIQRGTVHDMVANRLNVKLTNGFCLLVRECMVDLGASPYLSRGKYFYKNVAMKEVVCA